MPKTRPRWDELTVRMSCEHNDIASASPEKLGAFQEVTTPSTPLPRKIDNLWFLECYNFLCQTRNDGRGEQMRPCTTLSHTV